MNVGANSVTDCGNYYMYGMGSKTYDTSDTPYAGTEDPLAASADTASVVWGGQWHMPTKTQIDELANNTTYQTTSQDGAYGMLFTAQNGNSIFLPHSGYYNNSGELVYTGLCMYYSSTPHQQGCWHLVAGNNEGDDYCYADSYGSIAHGLVIRPVVG
jgi:hypothetical protein